MQLKNKQTVVYVFSNDLRLQDNHLFNQACLLAAKKDKSLLCIYCLPAWSFPKTANEASALGFQRFQFLVQSLKDLREQLQSIGLSLLVRFGALASVFPDLTKEHSISDVFHNQSVGWYERVDWLSIRQANFGIRFHTDYLSGLFRPVDLPFSLSKLPKHFTPFRQQIEELPLRTPQLLETLSVRAEEFGQIKCSCQWSQLEKLLKSSDSEFYGGEQAAHHHLKNYFNSQNPSKYKQVRNQLMGWENSTKFSPWLALGCISPLQIMQQLRQFETENGANVSTYWIYFELLWREYFYWNAMNLGAQLFNNNAHLFKSDQSQNTFNSWCDGKTGESLIDACMRELKETGYLSNRGRQIAASFLINELKLDWRLGANYFEKMLIDYDVASNWGNWQYIAGVGADPRGGRHFNVKKQQKTHDPEGHYIKKWSTFESKKEDVLWLSLISQ